MTEGPPGRRAAVAGGPVGSGAKAIPPQDNNVNGPLIDANDPGENLGVQNIHRRVDAINGTHSAHQGTANGGGGCGEFCTANNLTTAEADAKDINRVVQTGVTPHATAICKGLSTLALVTGITGC